MTFQQELDSWKTPSAVPVESVPIVGQPARPSPELPFPDPPGKPTIITFLRHCGCPFAEKTFRKLRDTATRHPEITFIAISHSSQSATDNWLAEVGGCWDVQVIVDPERKLYAQWGLGVSSSWHVLNPWSLLAVYKLGKGEGIWNRGTESGTRWQTSGSFAIDKEGMVRWVEVARSADEIADFEEALVALGVKVRKKKEEPMPAILGHL